MLGYALEVLNGGGLKCIKHRCRDSEWLWGEIRAADMTILGHIELLLSWKTDLLRCIMELT